MAALRGAGCDVADTRRHQADRPCEVPSDGTPVAPHRNARSDSGGDDVEEAGLGERGRERAEGHPQGARRNRSAGGGGDTAAEAAAPTVAEGGSAAAASVSGRLRSQRPGVGGGGGGVPGGGPPAPGGGTGTRCPGAGGGPVVRETPGMSWPREYMHCWYAMS